MSFVRIGPLVRATTATEATIWFELSQPCTVQLQVTPYNAATSEAVTIDAPSITIGGHYYATPQVTHLQPATWYHYRLSIAGQEQDSSLLQCFRTLTPSSQQTQPLRLIYGSCR
jgi:phosphodiesterase/alkaline phosphatase D-like protein